MIQSLNHFISVKFEARPNTKRGERKMDKYIAVLCYQDSNMLPAFKHTDIFEAENEEQAYEIGEEMIDRLFQDEFITGYNSYVINLSSLEK